MKIQNYCTIEQAKALDKAIKEAGLEWPPIKWERGIYSINPTNYIGLIHESDRGLVCKSILPCPSLAELLKMINNPENPLIQMVEIGDINIANAVQSIIYACSHQVDQIKSLWKSIGNQDEFKHFVKSVGKKAIWEDYKSWCRCDPRKNAFSCDDDGMHVICEVCLKPIENRPIN